MSNNPNWVTPPSTLGTNIGTITKSGSSYVFTRNTDPNLPMSGGAYIPDNGIINCTNAVTGSGKTSIALKYDVDSNTHFSQLGNHANDQSNTGTFIVMDSDGVSNPPATVTVSIYAWDTHNESEPSTPTATVSVQLPAVPLVQTNSVNIWDYEGTPQSEVAIAVAPDNSTPPNYPLTFTNRTSYTAYVWRNGQTGSVEIDPGTTATTPIEMSSNESQWFIGFSDSDDPTIVVRRPPNYKTGG
ncbi:MAG: hypothetical protein AAF799_09690 [Myxococcota bacterium]